MSTKSQAQPATARRFTGTHAAGFFAAFFGVVIAVNFTMARLASSTFGGTVVDNSYVASQKFNRWLDEASAEKALGWKATITRAQGRVAVTLTGVPATSVRLTGMARHPLGAARAVPLTFTADGKAGWTSNEALPAGRWRVRIDLESGAGRLRQEADIR